MLISRIIKGAGRRGWITPAKAKAASKWVAHVEHAGGGVVGIEFMAPHYFSPITLAVFAAAFLVIHIMAAVEGVEA